ncbi:MAG: triose-phosphate isomerase [Candidatus Pacebacteria bacterium]|nr:triose-phosphate isomerase [Candidatus Paceibacterota bacterium]
MSKVRKKLIIANWKMNPQSAADAKRLFAEVKQMASKLAKVQTVIAPPSIYLPILSSLYRGHRILLSAQNMFWEEKGSYTGEVSPKMLKDIGATYVILGHSERRAQGEDDQAVNRKVLAALKAGITPVVCVGESDRDHREGTHLTFLRSQITKALKGVSERQLVRIVIAYEPIWAIGKGEGAAMQPDELHETVLFIRKIITELYKKQVAFRLPVIYGGSVEPGNVATLLAEGEVDGLLVGHASLSAKSFNEILKFAQGGVK